MRHDGGMTDVVIKRDRFRALHGEAELFVLPNPWDVGSAVLLALSLIHI